MARRRKEPSPATRPAATATLDPADAPKRFPRSRGRRALFAALALLLGLAASLLLLEVGLRLFQIAPERYPPKENLVLLDGNYQNLGYTGSGQIKRPSRFPEVEAGEYVPGAVFKTVYASNPRGYFDPGNSVPSRINSLGMRGPEVSQAKPSGTFRILGVGDSFTYGAGVREEHTFLRQLEKSLNTGASPGRHEVLNAGVEGYNTRDEVLYLEHEWMKLSPDLILITYYLNDAYSEATFANEGQALGVHLDRPEGMARVSLIWDHVQHAIRRREESRRVQEFYTSSYFATPEEMLLNPGRYEFEFSDSVQALRRAAELAREGNARIALVIFPELYRLDEGYPFEKVHGLVASAAKSLEIPVLDLLSAFRGKRDRDLWVHPSDHHPNEVAHRIAAESIEQFLRKESLIDG